MLNLTPVPALSDNYVYILANDEGHCLIVDPGEAEPVIAHLEQHGLTPDTILLTHHHADHIGGTDALKQRYGCHVIAPEDSRIKQADRRVRHGDVVEVTSLGQRFTVIDTPGHTIGHIAFAGSPWLFCGDTLFSIGCGRLFEGTPTQMQQSIDRLLPLPDDTLVCCAHEYTQANGRFARQVEPDNQALSQHCETVAQWRAEGKPSVPTTLCLEKAINPFLRTRQASVIAAAQQREPDCDGSPESVFAVIRRWKDQS